jgi:malate dehydrogenase (oxaloacetate-decarboxylating)
MVAAGLSEKEAFAHFWIIDKDGLLDSSRRDLSSEQKIYARDANEVSAWPRNAHNQIGLAEVLDQINATVLIGLSTVKGAFTEAIVRKMAQKTERPIIFPLSNPTSHSEAEPADLIAWTEGRALVATGSPFLPVRYGGRTIDIAQCNNVFIFPAIGLGVTAARASRVTDRMMLAAAKALGGCSPTLKDPNASLLPSVKTIRDVAREIGYAAARAAQEEGLAASGTAETLRQKIVDTQWPPEYLAYDV